MKVLKGIALVIALLVAVGFVLKDPLWSAIKPHFGKYMRTFPESVHRNAEVGGSYASKA